MSTTARLRVAAIAIAATVLFLVWLVWFFGSGGSFREGFLANLFATLFGVAIAIPVGLAIDRWRQTAESKLREADVLRGLRKELTENFGTIEERVSDQGYAVAVPFLQSQVWEVMSDGGELRWVSSLELLRLLGRAYLYVGTLNYLEHRLFEDRHYPGLRASPIETVANEATAAGRILHFLLGMRPIAIREIGVCIEAINERIGAPDEDQEINVSLR